MLARIQSFNLLAQPFGIWVTSIYGCFQELGVPQKGWFMMENTIKIDDLGVPLFLETPIYAQ